MSTTAFAAPRHHVIKLLARYKAILKAASAGYGRVHAPPMSQMTPSDSYAATVSPFIAANWQ